MATHGPATARLTSPDGRVETREVQVEDGIVLEAVAGTPVRVRVRLQPGPGCEACGARPFCEPDGSDRREMLARVRGAVPPVGATVRVVVTGSRLAAAGAWAYGLPLLATCLGTTAGWMLFAGSAAREALAAGVGLAMTTAAFGVLWYRARSRPEEEWLDAWVEPAAPQTDSNDAASGRPSRSTP